MQRHARKTSGMWTTTASHRLGSSSGRIQRKPTLDRMGRDCRGLPSISLRRPQRRSGKSIRGGFFFKLQSDAHIPVIGVKGYVAMAFLRRAFLQVCAQGCPPSPAPGLGVGTPLQGGGARLQHSAELTSGGACR
ncbi:hypothetical protein AAFF_G00164080 [Aldrovandia affinis]|uniref:Uncharacterized protein n=1 Tax=Aldrovandia affinis TaxID=143900 RepID=A0AAD7WWH8_9TELE|nr:hypothetical protein AAFF_G00164080 [Aldrovandia affinis]